MWWSLSDVQCHKMVRLHLCVCVLLIHRNKWNVSDFSASFIPETQSITFNFTDLIINIEQKHLNIHNDEIKSIRNPIFSAQHFTNSIEIELLVPIMVLVFVQFSHMVYLSPTTSTRKKNTSHTISVSWWTIP